MKYRLKEENFEIAVSNILDIGEILLTSGAEVSRVEDTMERIGKAYGFSRVDAFAITPSIVYTAVFFDKIVTQTRRIKETNDNMYMIEQANDLSRRICREPVDMQKLKYEIEKVKNTKKYSRVVLLFAYMLISVSFTLFFGGNINDAVASMISGGVLFVIVFAGEKIHMQKIVLIILSSFITGMTANLMIWCNIGQSFDKIIIGNIMLLIPGKAFTNSFRDMIKGDVMSGSFGLLEAVFKAMAIALGYGLAMYLRN